MLRLLANKKLLVYVLLGTAALLAMGYIGVKTYGNARYNAGVKDSEALAREAAMKQFIDTMDRMITFTHVLQDEIVELRNAGTEIRTRYITVRDSSPMPDDCRAGPERMSIFSGAIQAATPKSGAGTALPAPADTRQ